jgi:hypothetical protein
MGRRGSKRSSIMVKAEESCEGITIGLSHGYSLPLFTRSLSTLILLAYFIGLDTETSTSHLSTFRLLEETAC